MLYHISHVISYESYKRMCILYNSIIQYKLTYTDALERPKQCVKKANANQ